VLLNGQPVEVPKRLPPGGAEVVILPNGLEVADFAPKTKSELPDVLPNPVSVVICLNEDNGLCPPTIPVPDPKQLNPVVVPNTLA